MRYIAIIIAAAFTLSVSAVNRHIKKPVMKANMSQLYDIESITLSDTATVVSMSAHYIPRLWILCLGDKVALRDNNGNILPLRYTNGIEANQRFYTNRDWTRNFEFVFDPISPNATSVDLADGWYKGVTANYAFSFLGIDITGKAIPQQAPKGYSSIANLGKVDTPSIKYKKKPTTATLNIHIMGYNPIMSNIIRYVIDNSIYMNRNMTQVEIDSLGNATIKLDVTRPTPLTLIFSDLYFYAIIEPGKTTDLIYNLSARNHTDGDYVWVKGPHAGIIIEMNKVENVKSTMDRGVVEYCKFKDLDTNPTSRILKVGMTMEDIYQMALNVLSEREKEINEMQVSDATKTVLLAGSQSAVAFQTYLYYQYFLTRLGQAHLADHVHRITEDYEKNADAINTKALKNIKSELSVFSPFFGSSMIYCGVEDTSDLAPFLKAEIEAKKGLK